jgi:uncharacterized protein YoxC
MNLPSTTSPRPSERTAVLERDLYHLEQRMMSTIGQIDHLGARVHALSDRIQRAETVLDQSIKDIAELSTATSHLTERVPDIEGVLKLLRWASEGLKYLIGIGLVAAAISGKLSMDVLSALFG